MIEVTVQLYDGPDVLWGYTHRECVVPLPPTDSSDEAMGHAVIGAQLEAGVLLLERLDEARKSLERQIQRTAKINQQAASGGD